MKRRNLLKLMAGIPFFPKLLTAKTKPWSSGSVDVINLLHKYRMSGYSEYYPRNFIVLFAEHTTTNMFTGGRVTKVYEWQNGEPVDNKTINFIRDNWYKLGKRLTFSPHPKNQHQFDPCYIPPIGCSLEINNVLFRLTHVDWYGSYSDNQNCLQESYHKYLSRRKENVSEEFC